MTGSAPTSPPRAPRPAPPLVLQRLFGLGAGVWLGISLLKLGNPIILDKLIDAPRNGAELMFAPWPFIWGCVLATVVAFFSWPLFSASVRRQNWPIWLGGAWLLWQFVSASTTVDPALTKQTLLHFTICGLAFVLGYAALPALRERGWLWTPLLVSFWVVLYWGFDQRHGGIEAMREAFSAQPNWQSAPRELILKMQTNRVFSTLVYPNAFAGVILLLLPVLFWAQWQLTARWPRIFRAVLAGLLGYFALGCLFWTGSKGGWLVALVITAVLLLQLSLQRKLKIALVSAGVVLGLTVFLVRFSGYFREGAPSVGARFDYWTAAVQAANNNPLLGTGPGTFQVSYKNLKRPDAEMTRLAHNDYLEQASDSGWPGFLAYTGFIVLSLLLLFRRCRTLEQKLVWAGLLGWSLQGALEFGLYIPALAWPSWFLIGWLWSFPPLEPEPIQVAGMNR